MIVTKTDLINGLIQLGIQKNTYIMVHSALSSFGVLEGGANTLIEILQNIITSDGLLIMPTFTYGQEPFDILRTPSKTGYVTEIFRTTPGVSRSEHPTHSICAWGKQAKEYTNGHRTESAFGIGSPFYKFYKNNGYILLIGVDYTSCSMIHLSQELACVDYLNRFRSVEIFNEDKSISLFKTRRAGCSLAFNNIKSYINVDQVKKIMIGNSLISLISSSTVVEAGIKILKYDQESLCCNKPDCISCNMARLMIKDREK